ncbi:MAG: phenylalanine--tRNA ligase subunit beta, partial [Lentisphaerae bacterium]|nr:phenylalanine--tRNA ligase subunit beta [Lentisphaerota bacterium]
MKVPVSWLKEFLGFDWTIDELAAKLTFSGLEVEGIEYFGHDYEGIVAAEILAIRPHPNADNLLLCDINNGIENLTVVCGANNFAVGDKAVFAGVGTILPNGMKLKKAKIRGEVSLGMLCAEDELLISEDHSGIIILPADTVPGTELVTIMGGKEAVIELEVTPNRPDCLSIIGVARELAALLGDAKHLSFSQPQLTANSDRTVSVTIEDPDGCPRYTASLISGIRIGPSPMFIQRRLQQCGIRAINNVVDITNYVMLETGQPLHAFDSRLVDNREIVVRRARANETITTLDGEVRELDEGILVIADSHKPVAIAGIMGGEHSGVQADTTEVILESASFNPTLVRRASRQLGLASESSARFEKGVDPQMAGWAGKLAAGMMFKYCGATGLGKFEDLYPTQPAPGQIKLRRQYLTDLLGIDIGIAESVSIFRALNMEIVEESEDFCVVIPPSFRLDLENETDLCEEVARIHGLDNIPAPSPRSIIVPEADDKTFYAESACRTFLSDSGLTEIMNYSFLSKRLLDLFSTEFSELRVALPNPISADHGLLRNSLIPQLVETLGRNRSHQIQNAGVFEIGRVFYKDEAELSESTRLAIGLMGDITKPGGAALGAVDEAKSFSVIKGVFDRLCKYLKIGGCRSDGIRKNSGYVISPIEQSDKLKHFPVSSFENGMGFAIMLDNLVIGIIGIVKRKVRGEWRLSDPVVVLEVDLDPLLKRYFKTPTMEELPVYPSVQRDLALIVPEHIGHGDIVAAIEKFPGKELTEIHLFDIYRSDEIGVGKKSLAYSFTYRSAVRTLTDDEVNIIHERIRTGLKESLPVEIR